VTYGAPMVTFDRPDAGIVTATLRLASRSTRKLVAA